MNYTICFLNVFEIESDVALPSSVPIKKLVEIGRNGYSDSRRFELLDREQRSRIVDALDIFNDNPELITKVRSLWGDKREELEYEAVDSLKLIISALDEVNLSQKEKEKREKEFSLAHKLICKIAKVDTDALLDLSEAVKQGTQGYANGIIEKINRQLSVNLNFPNYWVQDRNFSLKVMARDYDLVFTITDRTGTEYSFEERSQGLRYFLSYYIQYRAHEPHSSKSEILLMDEPDAYLSSQAQQDLLNVFNLFASPDTGSHLSQPIQVVYVTHSPFLIDKNHAERIRVLQKGAEDEGTRVVKDAAKNHYEPLRSSIGAYVGETAFIGNCNLMVEGLSDQILIAGATTYLRSKGISNLNTLDLNTITIVPSGSASHIPYLVYLARGRDVEQPAVIVLLDSDSSGTEAKKQLLGKGGRLKRLLLKEQFILQIGDLNKDFHPATNSLTDSMEIEDIVPLPICLKATKLYLQEFLKTDERSLDSLTKNLVLGDAINHTILDAIQVSLQKTFDENLKINKVGFARNVIRVVNDWSADRKNLSSDQSEALEIFEKNFIVLFKKMNNMQRRAQQKLKNEKLSQKIERIKKNFNALHPVTAKREDGVVLLEEIEAVLESNTEESIQEIEAIKQAINNLRRDYKLDTDMNKSIDDYLGFQKGLERIKYAGLRSSQEEEVTSREPSHEPKIVESEVDEKVPSAVASGSQIESKEIAGNGTEQKGKRKSGSTKKS